MNSRLKSEFKTEAHFQSFEPLPQLTDFIYEYWIMDLKGVAEHEKRELEQPSIFPEIIFKYGVDYESIFLRSNDKATFSTSTISGVCDFAKASKRIKTDQRLFMVGIKLKPLGMFTLSKMPLIELYQQIISIEEASIPFLTELEDQIYSLASHAEIINTLDQSFSAFFNQQDISVPGTQFIQKMKGLNLLRLNDLILDQGLNYKYLERNFKKYFGINPKKFSRLLRYQAFYKDWLSLAEYKYIDLVYKHDYYDQNHLIKDFKAILNTPPSKFLKSMNTHFTQHITKAAIAS